jgi:acetyl esterase/lipase
LLEVAAAGSSHAKLPAGVKVLRDMAYGPDVRHRFDVYIPPAAKNTPVLFLVHDGGWKQGDKVDAFLRSLDASATEPQGRR